MKNFRDYLKSINYTYVQPKALLSKDNVKTIKGEKKGYETFILYMSPQKQNSLGKNLCAKATEGCTEAIELLQKDAKNDVEIWELWTEQQKNSSNFGMCFPEFYINGENIECDNYDDAIIALERISEI